MVRCPTPHSVQIRTQLNGKKGIWYNFWKSCANRKDGKIVTDLYRKESDINEYPLTSSFHWSSGLRIVRICSEPVAREGRCVEQKYLLNACDYRTGMIDAVISKTRAAPRAKASKHVICKVSDRSFAVWSRQTLDSLVSQLFSINTMVATDQYRKWKDSL